MKPEEMRDDIPADVREALAEAIHGGQIGSGLVIEAIRPKPRTIYLPAAELPAPLKEVPEKEKIYVLAAGVSAGVRAANTKLFPDAAAHSVKNSLAFATQEDAEAWLAHMQSWKRPGADWTPHTPGDPMPCDGRALVDVRFRDGDVSRSDHADHYGWQRLDEDRPHDYDIVEWRYAREEA